MEVDIVDVEPGLVAADNTLWRALLVPYTVVDKTALELEQRLEPEQELEEQGYHESVRVLHSRANVHVLRFRVSARDHHHRANVHDLHRHASDHDHRQHGNAHDCQLVVAVEQLAMEHTTLVAVEGKLVVVEVVDFG